MLAVIPEKDRAKEVRTLDLMKEQLPQERTQWDAERDVFTFGIIIKSYLITRRGIGLGFLAPIILVAKQIVQSFCKLKLSWDEKISQDITCTWEKWLDSLHLLDTFHVDWSFFPKSFDEVTSAQLHHFCDASEVGYGAVSYLQLTNLKDEVHVSFAFGKAKVAPIKCTTIPRLELAADALDLRLLNAEKRVAVLIGRVHVLVRQHDSSAIHCWHKQNIQDICSKSTLHYSFSV